MREKTLRRQRQGHFEAKGHSMANALGLQWGVDGKGPSMAKAF